MQGVDDDPRTMLNMYLDRELVGFVVVLHHFRLVAITIVMDFKVTTGANFKSRLSLLSYCTLPVIPSTTVVCGLRT